MPSDRDPLSPYASGEMPEVGDRVMIVTPDDFVAPTANKVRDRIGIVKAFSYPSSQPMVHFEAAGRKKAFDMGSVRSRWLKLVERATPPSDS